jgi:hypothetical protein
MSKFDWYKIKFLESANNLKPLIKARIGIYPNGAILREIVSCLRQGRLFYEAASRAPLEISPLLLFYGMVGFAKAIVLARNPKNGLSTFCAGHGLKDKSPFGCKIENLKVRIEGKGTYQYFNDAMASINRFCHISNYTYAAVRLSCSTSSELANLNISLKEILSRIPAISELFEATFKEGSKSLFLDLACGSDDIWQLKCGVAKSFSGHVELRTLVQELRSKYQFLNKWCFMSASQVFNDSWFYFENYERSIEDEFEIGTLRDLPRGEIELLDQNRYKRTRMPIDSLLPPLAGSFALEAINGLFPSEFSLHYMGLFLLSSLVRYRPQTWEHAISRSITTDDPADDQMIALIEKFLEINSLKVPEMIVTILNNHEDKYPL